MLRMSPAASLILLLLVPAGVSASPAVPSAQTVHVVQSGENIWTIAQRHGLSPDRIVSTNHLQNPDRLQIGDRLTIPAVAAMRVAAVNRPATAERKEEAHVVRPGETLWSVAREHGTTVNVLAERNGLVNVDRLQPGQKILLPFVAAPQRSRQPAPQAAPATPSRLRLQWRWPSRGVITSRFGFRGRRHHHGIDIAAPIGTPIFAVRDGTVQFADRKGAYGLLVIVEHGDGLTTWYGHASRILVTVGERVTPGQTIAAIGTTGNVTGPNVHFEVRRNDVPLDPLRFLQSR